MKATTNQRSKPVWGTGGREFESRRSDHKNNALAKATPRVRTPIRTEAPARYPLHAFLPAALILLGVTLIACGVVRWIAQ